MNEEVIPEKPRGGGSDPTPPPPRRWRVNSLIRTIVDMKVFSIAIPLHNLCAINVSVRQNVMTIAKWRYQTEISLKLKR